MRRFAPPAAAAVLLAAVLLAAVLLAAAAAGWFAYSSYAAVRSDFGGNPAIGRL